MDGDPTDSPMTSETYFLEAALRLAPPNEVYADSPYMPRVVSCTGGIPLPDFGGAAAIVLANTGHLSQADADRLARFVAAGGGVARSSQVIDANKMASASWPRPDIALGQFVTARSTSELPWRLDRWD